jgi:hypothetical protein
MGMGFARCRIWMGDWKAVVRYRKGNLEPGLGLGLGKGGVGGVVIVRDADDRMGGISVVRMGGGRGVIGVQCGLKWWFGI